jgi:hypothetical protein
MTEPKWTLSSVDVLPGMTRCWTSPADTVKPAVSLTTQNSALERPVILIATAAISDSNLFNNGLYQNCFMIYRMCEAMGYLPIFVVNQRPRDLTGIPDILRQARIAEVEDILRIPLKVEVYLEIGMSISANLRRYIKLLGAKICKLYLGNILNIDIETPMFFPGLNFSHHVTGETDEIWTSPHYYMNLEYAACLNGVEPIEGVSARIAPYVWDPCILTDDGRRSFSWRPRKDGEKPTLLIMEPNISFQKCALVPILIAEEYARLNPTSDFELVIFNGDRLLSSGYYQHCIVPSLSLAKQNRIKYLGRHSMIDVIQLYPHATAICHQVNNEYNYMVLEFLQCGFPVLHNSKTWRDFGYSYPENDIAKAARDVLGPAMNSHHDNLELYKSHARSLFWRHCIYNPEIQKGWIELFSSRPPKA